MKKYNFKRNVENMRRSLHDLFGNYICVCGYMFNSIEDKDFFEQFVAKYNDHCKIIDYIPMPYSHKGRNAVMILVVYFNDKKRISVESIFLEQRNNGKYKCEFPKFEKGKNKKN